VKSFLLGRLEISVLRDGALVFPNDGSIFGVNAGPRAMGKVLSEARAPTDKIQLDIDTLLIRMPDHIVLLDGGYGLAGHGVVQGSLALVGVSPDSITDILITHAHPDHVGGLVDARDDPPFPRRESGCLSRNGHSCRARPTFARRSR
jgi:glyoxylase-like metal-dependent hydrolase (beta-lactamase superfamily II)